NGADASEIGTGKAYQLTWNLVALAKLNRATADARFLEAARNGWDSIRSHHLTLGGGPWGGVAHRSREVFNPAGVFSPYGYVETCSILAWIQLNRELLAITGEAKYADEIERSAYNDLIGAQAPNGEDWIYYSFPNGARVFTTYWRCCKSSGAMALEELPAIAYRAQGDEIAVNLYGEGEAWLDTNAAGSVHLVQSTGYPFDGDVRMSVTPSRPARFTIRARIPAWAAGARVALNDCDVAQPVEPGTYIALDRHWNRGDEIKLVFPMQPSLHRKSNRSVQQTFAPDGAAIEQEVMRFEYVAITRGPLVYATDRIDGFRMEETISLSREPTLDIVAEPGYEGPAIRLHREGRAPLAFHPYFEAGGRAHGTWRLTWLNAVGVDEKQP
ncbi:MAG TPA: beta-L-arabinofuranosidase domain-containing protein, partial [Steroidobacteraceae bacterium]|nr:beta-L-arabinofuranosidase domain-containing protein [Steroidobacteraceae bacterium]